MDKSIRNLFIALVVSILFVLPASIAAYNKNHAIPAAKAPAGEFSNVALLQETIPNDVIEVTGKVLNNYMNGGANALSSQSYRFVVSSDVVVQDGNYQFLVKQVGGGKTLNIKIFDDMSGGIPAVTVWINGVIQPAAV